MSDVLIVGGGLSGLHTAYELNKRKVKFVLIEARERLGGRILSDNASSLPYTASQPAVDFGPAWFWPGQTRIERLIGELGLSDDVFLQNAQGDSLYEDHQSVQRGIAGVSMQGSYRLRAGMGQLIAALGSKLAGRELQLGGVLRRLSLHKGEVTAEVLVDGEPMKIASQRVILAMPPRLISESVEFSPALPDARMAMLANIPTWMAGHAKMVATYGEPFWRSQGLSGDVISHRGPLSEIHDASAQVGEPYALFGFLAVAAAERAGNTAMLKGAAVEQLTRLFGGAAASPLNVSIMDWAAEPFTASLLDQEIATAHTLTSINVFSEADWAHRLIFSGSETAAGAWRNNGYLEGALEASERAIEFALSK